MECFQRNIEFLLQVIGWCLITVSLTCKSGAAGKIYRYTLRASTAMVTGGMLSRPTRNSCEAKSNRPSWELLCRVRIVR